MFLRQTLIETRKTLAHPALWLGLAGLTLLLAAFTVIRHAQLRYGYTADEGGLAQDLIYGLVFFGWAGSLVYAVSAAVIAAYDYPDRSLQVWLMRGVPRPTLLLARLAVVLVTGQGLVAYATASLLAISALSRLAFFGQVDASQVNWNALLPAALRLYGASLPYLALTVLLGVASRSPLFAAAGTVVYAAVIERLAGSLADRFPLLVRYLPASLGSVLQEYNLTLALAAPAPEPAMPGLRALLFIGLIALALTGAALLIFSRQDLGG